MGPILVAFATKHGSTREVAEEVAHVLVQSGFEVEIRPAGKAKDSARFAAVVLGGALYMGRLHKDARRFLNRERATLAAPSFAVFAMGPRSLEPDAVERSTAQLNRALEQSGALEPVAKMIFGGVYPKHSIDARDWDAIRAWAEEVARLFAKAELSNR